VNGGIPGSSATVLQFTSFGESWYKGMTVELRKRLSHRYQLMASYTLSKSEDTSTDFQTSFLPQNNGYGRNPSDPTGLPLGFDPRSERGPSTQDQRHRFVLSGVYDMPWRLQLSGIVVLGSGRPFTPLAGSDLNGDANGGQFPPDRARATQADESSSVGRNSEMTVGYATVDTRVSRQFALGRRGSVDVMLEAFNLFNRVNFVEDTNQSSFVIFGSGSYPANPLPAYGHYTMTMPPRQVQLAVRVSF
jgi:outer membrane receptor for Fe3+-dicitrate